MSKRTHHDFKGLQDWVPIFKAGPQKDSLGREKVWSHDELDQIVANHDPDHPAPHVITHKELYSPFAYGQSAELKREGDVLYVKSKNIEPQFEKLIKDGRLFERSVRLVPSPKGWKLGHIAWLGAEPPAVDGLAPVQFSAATEAHDYSVDWRATSTLARMMRRLREFLIAKFGAEEADRVMPEWDVEDLTNAAAEHRAEEIPASPSFSAPTQQGDVSMLTEEDLRRAREEARAEAQAEFAAQQTTLQQQLQAERMKNKRAEFAADVTAAIDRGVAPALVEGMTEFMLAIDAEPAEFEFSAGDATKTSSPAEFVRELLKRLPASVDVGGARGGEEASGGAVAEFAAPEGYTVDAASAEIDRQARAYMAQHPETTYQAAVQAVTR